MTRDHDYTMDDFHAEMRRREAAKMKTKTRPRGPAAAPLPPPNKPVHGNTIIKVVPCGVHPLHSVKVHMNGSHSGCPMCDAQIEDVCRSLKQQHTPLIAQDRTWIVGCTCGWRTPPGTTDSDDAFAMHGAIATATSKEI
jgi:hypothetical protein